MCKKFHHPYFKQTLGLNVHAAVFSLAQYCGLEAKIAGSSLACL